MARVCTRRKADSLPPPASLWDATTLPGGAPLHALCFAARTTRQDASAVRSHVAPDASAALRLEIARIEDDIAIYHAAREADVADVARADAFYAARRAATAAE